MPTIEQIRSVYEIAKTGSISQAAKNLYTSQPYLSTILKEVEQELMIRLFVRNNRGVTPTEQGVLFLQYAEEILALMQRIDFLKYQVPPPADISLTVVGIYAIIMHEIFNLFFSMHQDKRWKLSYIERPHHKILEMLITNQADIGIQTLDLRYEKQHYSLFSSKDLVFHPLYKDEICILLGEKHPLFYKNSVFRKELEPYPFVTAQNMSLPEDFLMPIHIKKSAFSFENSRNLIYHVSQSTSYTFGVPVVSINDPLLKMKKLKYLKIEDYQYPIQIGYLIKKETAKNKALEAYIAFLTDFFDHFHPENIYTS